MKFASIVLLLIAAYFRSGPLVFAVGIVLVLLLASHIWLSAICRGLQIDRSLDTRLFFDETMDVTLSITNTSSLPVPWLELHESLPAALVLPNLLSRVIALGARQRVEIAYTLRGRRRGVHLVGPLHLAVGDVFGLARRELQMAQRHVVVVYPRMLAPSDLDLPAALLFGEIRSRRPFLGDPARIGGIRPYVPGDPLHDIHWRASAATNTLQVKQYQPATTLEVTVFVDLHRDSFSSADPLSAAELAITIAATVARQLIDQRQHVGVVTNGRLAILPEASDEQTAQRIAPGTTPTTSDPETNLVAAAPIPAGNGQGQLMRILEMLARVELSDQGQHIPVLIQQSGGLTWGSTVVVVTGQLHDTVLHALRRIRQRGTKVLVFTVEQQQDREAAEARAHAAGITMRCVWTRELFERSAS